MLGWPMSLGNLLFPPKKTRLTPEEINFFQGFQYIYLGKPSNKKRWKSSIFFFFFLGGGVRRFPSFLKLIFRINLISISLFSPLVDMLHKKYSSKNSLAANFQNNGVLNFPQVPKNYQVTGIFVFFGDFLLFWTKKKST